LPRSGRSPAPVYGAAAAWPRAAGAQQSYGKFVAFLIDLRGWTGLRPTGTDEERKKGWLGDCPVARLLARRWSLPRRHHLGYHGGHQRRWRGPVAYNWPSLKAQGPHPCVKSRSRIGGWRYGLNLAPGIAY